MLYEDRDPSQWETRKLKDSFRLQCEIEGDDVPGEQILFLDSEERSRKQPRTWKAKTGDDGWAEMVQRVAVIQKNNPQINGVVVFLLRGLFNPLDFTHVEAIAAAKYWLEENLPRTGLAGVVLVPEGDVPGALSLAERIQVARMVLRDAGVDYGIVEPAMEGCMKGCSNITPYLSLYVKSRIFNGHLKHTKVIELHCEDVVDPTLSHRPFDWAVIGKSQGHRSCGATISQINHIVVPIRNGPGGLSDFIWNNIRKKVEHENQTQPQTAPAQAVSAFVGKSAAEVLERWYRQQRKL
jgi:hypothetical protein